MGYFDKPACPWRVIRKEKPAAPGELMQQAEGREAWGWIECPRCGNLIYWWAKLATEAKCQCGIVIGRKVPAAATMPLDLSEDEAETAA